MSSPARKRRPAAKPGAGETPKLSGLRGKRHGKSKEHAPAISEDELLALVPGGLATAFVNARMHDRALALAGLGEPSDWDGEMPELPEDIAQEDHDSLSRLLGKFASVLSTATWHAAKAYIQHGFYKQVADYLEDVAILSRASPTSRSVRPRRQPRRQWSPLAPWSSRPTRTTCGCGSLARR